MQASTATPQANPIPQSSAPSNVSVPAVASQLAPQIPSQPSGTTVPTQAAPAQTVNPWQTAYQNLAASLSSQPTSQSPAAYSGATPLAASPVVGAYPSMVGEAPVTASLSAPQTYFPQVTPAYSQALEQQARLSQSQAPQQAQVEVRDGYLNAVSLESLKVLKHFGEESPALLNRYSCVLEDALIKQANNITSMKAEYAQKFKQAAGVIQQLRTALGQHQTIVSAAAEDNAAYHIMLTNPHVLSSYVNEFFGKNGPYPVETSRDRLQEEVAASSQVLPAAADPIPSGVQTAGYQRPTQDIPTPGVQQNGGGQFWSQFSQLSDANPAMAWQMLSQAGPEDLRAKVLVSEA